MMYMLRPGEGRIAIGCGKMMMEIVYSGKTKTRSQRAGSSKEMMG